MKTITYTEVTCAQCATHFQIDTDLEVLRRADGSTFYCPNGHGQHYTQSATSKIEKLQEELDEAKADLEIARSEVTRLRCAAISAQKPGLLKRLF